jgi:hypothetical protein
MARERKKNFEAAPVNVELGEKAYVCNRYPSFRISGGIKFMNGVFKTGDLEKIKRIEKNDWYGVFIHPQQGAAPAVNAANVDRTGADGKKDESEEDKEA